jgi:hypothetical protein
MDDQRLPGERPAARRAGRRRRRVVHGAANQPRVFVAFSGDSGRRSASRCASMALRRQAASMCYSSRTAARS